MEDWSAIAADVAAGLGEVGLSATLTRTSGGAETPWGTEAATVSTYPVTVLEDSTQTRYGRDPRQSSSDPQGALVPRTVRVLMIAADGEAPQMGDTITLADGAHQIALVAPFQPGGVALYFEAEIAI